MSEKNRAKIELKREKKKGKKENSPHTPYIRK
jgi:hypothetical protein